MASPSSCHWKCQGTWRRKQQWLCYLGCGSAICMQQMHGRKWEMWERQAWVHCYCRAAGPARRTPAAVTKDSASHSMERGPELCCCSCLWPKAGQGAQNQAAPQPGGKGILSCPLNTPKGWHHFLVCQGAHCSSVQLQKALGKNPHVNPEQQVREQLEGSGKQSAIKGTCLHPYWNINNLSETTHLDSSAAMTKPSQDPLSLGQRAMLMHKWGSAWEIMHGE